MACRALAVAAGWAPKTAKKPRRSCTRIPRGNHGGGSILAAKMAQLLAATDTKTTQSGWRPLCFPWHNEPRAGD